MLFLGRLNFTLTYRPSLNTKPDRLSDQFTPDYIEPEVTSILSPSSIVGAATWQEEERVQEVLNTARLQEEYHQIHCSCQRLPGPMSCGGSMRPTSPAILGSTIHSIFCGNASGDYPWSGTLDHGCLPGVCAGKILTSTFDVRIFSTHC